MRLQYSVKSFPTNTSSVISEVYKTAIRCAVIDLHQGMRNCVVVKASNTPCHINDFGCYILEGYQDKRRWTSVIDSVTRFLCSFDVCFHLENLDFSFSNLISRIE
ncbi:hypothetical protein TNIN_238331 [Trichonephila inaurata madagascariensis]|uniref:Uncharacterized protein n=1 Tax=Trichonephila inaurata madagascariensis TaxID=2747483 RepID=A0A8X7CBU0_9ARAC|nr:hypothetical protein TNIN_238331 [Trichonephila inaurata madagascariensis]